MKTLFTLFLLASATAFSQRTADLEVEIISPASPLEIETGDVYDLDITITNMGPDAITADDTLKMMVMISGDTVAFPPQGYYLVYQEAIASGASVTITRTSAFDNSYDDSEFPMCVRITPWNGASQISDPTDENNIDCINVIVGDGDQLSVGENALAQTTAYPNPASAQFNIAGAKNGHIVVINAAGSIVKELEGSGTVDCSDWENGVYFVTVDGQNKAATKVTVLH
jgi:hypothetical protein